MRRIIAACVLLISSGLLFTRLGHYALWDDEAATALNAQGVWHTGDTTVIVGHNIVAYRSGVLLVGTKERSTPPLGAYLTAPFVGIFGNKAWAARLPFAIAGLGTVGLMLYWLYAIQAELVTWIIMGLGIIGNVSLFLYSRQCRYYSVATFTSVAIAYIYLNWNGSRRQLLIMCGMGILLLASNYLNYIALHACLLLDYAIVGRKRKWLTWQDWLIVLGPQIIIGTPIVAVWNTLRTGNKVYLEANHLGARLYLIWLNLRDANCCEFGPAVLILAAPVLYIWKRNAWFIRAPLAALVYVTVISLLSPQVVDSHTVYADVRYLAPLIPLGIAIGVIVLAEIARDVSPVLAVVMAVVAFGSNFFNGAVSSAPQFTGPFDLRSTLVLYIRELIHPPPEPYTAASDWINQNVQAGQSIWVLPAYATYPLMFHAPHAIYAWQLADPPPPAFADVPPIHIVGRSLPDFVICFGPSQLKQFQDFKASSNLHYDMVAALPVLFLDRYRPELFWHSFVPIEISVEHGQGIYIFKRAVSAPAGSS